MCSTNKETPIPTQTFASDSNQRSRQQLHELCVFESDNDLPRFDDETNALLIRRVELLIERGDERELVVVVVVAAATAAELGSASFD